MSDFQQQEPKGVNMGCGCVPIAAMLFIFLAYVGTIENNNPHDGDMYFMSNNTINIANDTQIDNSTTDRSVDNSSVDNSTTTNTSIVYEYDGGVRYCVPDEVAQRGDGGIRSWIANLIDSDEWSQHLAPCREE